MDEYKGIKSRRIRVCPQCGNEAPQRLAYHHCPNLDAGARKKKKGKIEVYWLAVCDTCNEFSIWGDEVFGGLVAWHSREHFLVYPSQPLVHSAIPEKVSRIYDEAKRIVNLAPNAFSVQIRRALEAICEDKGIAEGVLATRLKKLADEQHIPQSISGFADVIRLLGNVGAHAGSSDVSQEQAYVLNDFFRVVVEFVYVAPAKLGAFKASLVNSGITQESK